MVKAALSVARTYPKAKFGVMVVGGIPSDTERSAMDHIVATEIEAIKLKHPNYQRQAAL